MMAKKKKKNKVPTEEELQEIRRLKKQRVEAKQKAIAERKKLENEIFRKKFATIIVAVPLVIITTILIAIFTNMSIFIKYCFSVCLIITLLTDKSFMRRMLYKYYPEKFPFADKIKKDYNDVILLFDIVRTVGYSCVFCMYLFEGLTIVWTVGWIISVILAYYDKIKNSELHNLYKRNTEAFTFIAPGLMFLVNFERGWQIRWHAGLLLFMIIGSIAVTILLYNFTKNKMKKSEIASHFMFSALAFATICIGINRDFDFSQPYTYTSEIIDKFETTGRGGSHYLSVNDWIDENELYDVKVNSEKYDNVRIGDTVMLEIHDGALGMHYFKIVKNEVTE